MLFIFCNGVDCIIGLVGDVGACNGLKLGVVFELDKKSENKSLVALE